ncbi:MAG: molecular chaperone DnaK [Myxococcota bacterium]|jgi:molecular chaperone DnaK|nr:molecular chaperone DnaK [Myxococcota bacterium]
MGKVIGIDLGTTNSCVSVMVGGTVEVIANAEGSRTTPSMVAYTGAGEKLVGQIAKRQAVTNPERTIFACKRLIGRTMTCPEVESFAKVAPFPIVAAENDDAWVDVADSHRSPQEISALILAKMKDTASEYIGEPVTDAVVTVPAYFNDAQRQATKEACTIAGLNVQRIINEPTAAALAYGLKDDDNKKIVVFDLGGGTFDVSVLEIGDGVFEVKSTHGDTFLGGEDFDNQIVGHLAKLFEDENGIDLSNDSMALQRLKEAAERAKHELSSAEETDINLPFISATDDGPKHLALSLSRASLEELISEFIDRLEAPCVTALEDAGFTTADIDDVILVGGMTRMPRVQAKVEEIFGRAPNKTVNPDEVVAVGAAIQGAVLNGEVEDVLLLDVTPLSLGVETQGGVSTKIIEKNTTIPATKSQVFSTTEDNQDVVRIHVLQGERDMASDNMSLGRFELLGIPPAPRGVPQIEVTFAIDTDGVTSVGAKDLGTGKSQGIRVMAQSGLSEEQVEALVSQAEEHADDDRNRRGLIELKNKATGLVYSTERTLDEFGADITSDDSEAVRKAVENTSELITSGDYEVLKESVEALSILSYGMTEKLYAALGGDDDAALPPTAAIEITDEDIESEDDAE